jgi:hypothetical protein
MGFAISLGENEGIIQLGDCRYLIDHWGIIAFERQILIVIT